LTGRSDLLTGKPGPAGGRLNPAADEVVRAKDVFHRIFAGGVFVN
jgi:hypothetical protein